MKIWIVYNDEYREDMSPVAAYTSEVNAIARSFQEGKRGGPTVIEEVELNPKE